MKKNLALKISILSLSIALVAVFTIAVRIPTPGTGGYLSLCDAAVTFASFCFGPWTGFIAGGLGTAIADLIGGYPQWAIISFIVHGLEGLAIGLIVRSSTDNKVRRIIAAVVATLIVPLGYFCFTSIMLKSIGTAAMEILPNLAQGGVGAVIGLALYSVIASAYRNLDSLRLEKPKKVEES